MAFKKINGDLQVSGSILSNDKIVATEEYVNANKGSQLYRHHFDIILTHDDLGGIPDGMRVAINVNAISNSGVPWQTLSELDGGGFIISAFGTINYPEVITSYVFELKIFYLALNTLLLNIHDLNNNNIQTIAITTVFGGTSPSSYEIEDSVSKI